MMKIKMKIGIREFSQYYHSMIITTRISDIDVLLIIVANLSEDEQSWIKKFCQEKNLQYDFNKSGAWIKNVPDEYNLLIRMKVNS